MMNRWKIGDVTITRVVDSEELWQGSVVFPDMTREAVRAESQALYRGSFHDSGLIVLSFHTLVLESRGLKILVDTCIGNDKLRDRPHWTLRRGAFLSDLTRAGYPPHVIDRVVCTHLHIDHVGWNTVLVADRWLPTFPRARYLLSPVEWEYWSHFDDSHFRPGVEDSVRPLVEAGVVDWVAPDFALTDEVSLCPTPGHSPGHVCVRVVSQGQRAMITGDVIIHPMLCLHPEWSCIFDTDPDMARTTRLKFLEECVDKPILVFGTHFGSPSAGWIVRSDRTFRLAVEPPSYVSPG